MKKDILTLWDLTPEDFKYLFERAIQLKSEKKNGVFSNILSGRTLGLVFDKPSTRTRISFEAAMAQMGGTPIFINTRDSQISRNEPVRDTARVLSRYLDALVIRTFSQDLLIEFAEFSSIPVINALTDLYHPCQVLSDLMTVIELKGGYRGFKIAWIGDGNNVAHSWINAAAILGFHLELACPKGYTPNEKILKRAMASGKGTIRTSEDPIAVAKDAGVIYTDVWASMGQEREHAFRKKTFKPYCVDEELISHASTDVTVMHCLPAHRGEEIGEAVLEGPHSAVWDQSENKLHMHKAILETLIR
ncbi:MAG: ornithine carbamoyltransferase [Deltaproteobacteria bacterium RBG_13_49_15]|nr:MAG: ornithine carbamoyltransferase [Deltaproteobacteria bacterium RBG_13_49_15]